MIALTGCTGKLGGAVLQAIIEHNLQPPDQLLVCTTGNPEDSRWEELKKKGVVVRQSNFDDRTSMVTAFSGCDKLVLVSSPRISMDFHDAPDGSGREKDHIAAIQAAQAAGIKHIFYSSLAFGSRSKAGVMRAHNRTEAFLSSLRNTKFTVIREGLYNESWPLYFGHFDVKDSTRREVVVGGDGAINWTSIADLGFATGLVVVEPSARYVGQTLYLSGSETTSLEELAEMVSRIRGTEVSLKVVSREEYCRYYVEEKGMDRGFVEWWATTYDALRDGECHIKDGTLGDLFSGKGRTPEPFEETVRGMLEARQD